MIFLAFCPVLATGCSDSPSSKSPTTEEGTSESPLSAERVSDDEVSSSAAEDFFGTAVIRGVVKFEGERPPVKPLKMLGDESCHRPNHTVQSPRTMLSDSNGVPHVFVYIKRGVTGHYSPPTEPVTLEQTGCMFVPHVFGIQVGQPLLIINNDPTFHNVHSLARNNSGFNVSQPQKGMKTTRTFSRPEIMVKLKCDVHGWMEAYCGVLPHPFFTVTDENGEFEITRLPVGHYVLETRHELWGTLQQDVTVGDEEIPELTLTYSRKRKP